MTFGDFIVTPGIRYEDIELEQRRWSVTDPGRISGTTSVVRSEVDEVISGVGAVYGMAEAWTLLGGVHKGFNSPSPGSNAEAEESVNSEAGARYARQAGRRGLIALS